MDNDITQVFIRTYKFNINVYYYTYPNAMAMGIIYFGYMQDFMISSAICPAFGSHPIVMDNGI